MTRVGEIRLWIVGGTVLTMNERLDVFEDGAIGIADGKIAFVGKRRDAPKGAFTAPGVRVVDAARCLVTPGFVNGHTHTGMTLLRGVADDLPLATWLHDYILPLEAKVGDETFVYFGTLLAAAEMIRNGTTTFNDMYYFEEQAARAANEAGIRIIAGQTIVEIGQVTDSEEVIAKFDRYLETISEYPLAVPAITPHSIYGVRQETWKRIIRYAKQRDLFVHFHLSETHEEMDDCQKAFGRTPARVLHDLGLFELRSIAAHGTCVTAEDIELLGKYQVGVSHNPESNLKLGTRICPVVELRKAGVPVALGTDGTASNNDLDLLGEADTAAKLQVFRAGIGALTAEDTVKMLTCEGARAVGLGQTIGSIEVGKSADVIAVDVHKPHASPLYNPYSHLVYAAAGADVKHTIVNGKVLMENRELLTIDEEALLKEAAAWGKKISAQIN